MSKDTDDIPLTNNSALIVDEVERLRRDKHVVIEHDGFVGTEIGNYITREGKRGVVLQQVGTRVVHVYGEKWILKGE